MFFLAPIALLLSEKKQLKRIFKELYLVPLPKTLPTLVLALKMVGLFYVLVLAEAIVFLPFWDTSPVVEVLKESSRFMLVLAATLGPVSEEFFFRGFLQKRLGIIFGGFLHEHLDIAVTSLLFALLHAGIGSFAEVAGAFTAAAVIGYYLKRTGNIYACFLAHAALNTLSIIAVYFILPLAA